jgi:glyoxylase-like metal-dependent hydrolase (beta-lactamase superfamily II)
MNETLVHMETAIPDLYATAPHPLPFAPSLHIRSFLLHRDQGNVLVYAAPTVDADVRAIADLGGISRQYLNHGHEGSFAGGAIAQAFGAPIFVHERDRAAVDSKLAVTGTFSERETLDRDFEVIPTPGHTPGATAFLWDSGRHRVLFTGDTIYLDDGAWVAAILESSDRGPYLESLELIRDLDFDVLAPWAATGGQPYYAFTDRADAQRRIDAILERARRGEDR